MRIEQISVLRVIGCLGLIGLIGLTLIGQIVVLEPDNLSIESKIIFSGGRLPFEVRSFYSMGWPFWDVYGSVGCAEPWVRAMPTRIGCAVLSLLFVVLVFALVRLKWPKKTSADTVRLSVGCRIACGISVALFVGIVGVLVFMWVYHVNQNENGWVYKWGTPRQEGNCLEENALWEAKCPRCNRILQLYVRAQCFDLKGNGLGIHPNMLKECLVCVKTTEDRIIEGSQMKCSCDYFVDLPQFCGENLILQKTEGRAKIYGKPQVKVHR